MNSLWFEPLTAQDRPLLRAVSHLEKAVAGVAKQSLEKTIVKYTYVFTVCIVVHYVLNKQRKRPCKCGSLSARTPPFRNLYKEQKHACFPQTVWAH